MKDYKPSRRLGERVDLQLLGKDAVLKVYEQAIETGRGEEERSAVIKALGR